MLITLIILLSRIIYIHANEALTYIKTQSKAQYDILENVAERIEHNSICLKKLLDI